jgi:hypothetical protein
MKPYPIDMTNKQSLVIIEEKMKFADKTTLHIDVCRHLWNGLGLPSSSIISQEIRKSNHLYGN